MTAPTDADREEARLVFVPGNDSYVDRVAQAIANAREAGRRGVLGEAKTLAVLSADARRRISGDIEWTATQFREFMAATRALCDAVDQSLSGRREALGEVTEGDEERAAGLVDALAALRRMAGPNHCAEKAEVKLLSAALASERARQKEADARVCDAMAEAGRWNDDRALFRNAAARIRGSK